MLQKENAVLEFREFRPYATPVMDDPLEELLNEFSNLEEDLEEEFEEVRADVYNLAEIFNTSEDEDVVEFMDEQMEVLQDSTQRIRFYLDEIESFIPRK